MSNLRSARTAEAVKAVGVDVCVGRRPLIDAWALDNGHNGQRIDSAVYPTRAIRASKIRPLSDLRHGRLVAPAAERNTDTGRYRRGDDGRQAALMSMTDRWNKTTSPSALMREPNALESDLATLGQLGSWQVERDATMHMSTSVDCLTRSVFDLSLVIYVIHLSGRVLQGFSRAFRMVRWWDVYEMLGGEREK
uniref:Uncharacterized protein n=1 Tax=Plectus sambesii TaxID=2011161 RepID=A0A914UR42_9BILA